MKPFDVEPGADARARHLVESCRSLEPKCRPPPPVLVVNVSGNGGSVARDSSPPFRGSSSTTKSPDTPGAMAMFAFGTPAAIFATSVRSVVAFKDPFVPLNGSLLPGIKGRQQAPSLRTARRSRGRSTRSLVLRDTDR